MSEKKRLPIDPNLKELMETLRDVSTVDLAASWVGLRAEKEELEKRLREMNKTIDAYKETLCLRFEGEGLHGLRLASGASVSMKSEPYARVVDPAALRRWCMENGLENSLSLQWQTTNSLNKTRLENGQPELPGVETFHRDSLILRRG